MNASEPSVLDLRQPAQDPGGVALMTAETPAAVLMVDLASRTVVYANPVAEQMAPGVRLPVAVEAWSDAAVLRDLDGAELSETDHPLTRIARSEPVAGQAVSAARATAMGQRREPLWAVALTMGEAPRLAGHALVVFLPVREQDGLRAAASAAVAEAELREAAVLATGLSFTVADARAEDLPLVWVNPAFTATTGYLFEEAVGRNCRFLQGPATDRTSTAAMRAALAAGEEITLTLLNYRKDGTAFWNQLSMSPIRDAAGTLTHFVGIQTDVTGQVAADRERDRALAAEREARADAEAAHARLHLLAEASSQLAGTLDAEDAVARLAQLVVPALGDFSMVSLIDDASATEARAGSRGDAAGGRGRGEVLRELRQLRDVAWRHVDPSQEEELAALARHRIPSLTERSGIAQAYASGRPVVHNDSAAAVLQSLVGPGEAHRSIGALAPSSAVVLPLRGRGRTVGMLTVWRRAEREPFTDEEVALGEDLASRAGLALDSARLYRQQRDLAEGLQRSLLTLTTPPAPDHVQIAVRYVAAAEAAQVGGDWYDAFLQPAGATVLVIGDVVGHDTQAAAAMSQLRSILRALGAAADHGPSRVLAETDRVMATLGVATTATALTARLEHPGSGATGEGAAAESESVTVLRWSSAGHPPAMVVDPDGRVRSLESAEADLLLGVAPSLSRQEATEDLRRGTTVLLYTDGLVERRDQPLDAGLARLRRVLGDLAREDLTLEQLCDQVLDRMLPPRPDDDVALVAVHLHPEDRPRPPEAGPGRVPPHLAP